MHVEKLAAASLLVVLALWSNSAAAAIGTLSTDGWHTWQLQSVEPVAEMCCFSPQHGLRSQAGCALDGRRVSYVTHGDCSADAGYVQFYVLVESGRPSRIRALSSECPVSSETPITDHGPVSAAENIQWFRHVIEDTQLGQNVREEALFGLVQSESDAAYEYLDRLLSDR